MHSGRLWRGGTISKRKIVFQKPGGGGEFLEKRGITKVNIK